MKKETLPHEQTFTGNGATGLTKREFFAAMALQGLCASVTNTAEPESTAHCAEAAIHIADELIDELNRSPEDR